MISTASSRSSAIRVILLLSAVLILRLLYAAYFAVNPAGDEAYYWDWGRRLDYGYYSKPPLIAWIYALVDWLGGGRLIAFRAAAAILGTSSLLILWSLTRSLFDEKAAWIAVLLGLATPANSVLSFFLTIDAPLVFCWSIALWAFWKYTDENGNSTMLIVLFLSLAVGHLAKQMMMIFPLLAMIFLALSVDTRSLLRRSRLWCALLGSYLSLLPPLFWNLRHDWITFQHTGHHFEAAATKGSVLVERIGDFFSFLGTQMGVLSPGTGFVLASLCVVGLFSIRKANRPLRFLLVFGALPLAVMVLMAMRQEMQPNWAAVFYVSGLVMVAGWYSGAVTASYPPPSWRRLLPATLATGFVLVGYFYFASPIFALLGKEGHKADPNRRLLGYENLATQFQAFREQLPEGTNALLLATGHRDLTSQLAFGLPDQPVVRNLNPTPGISSQYDLWNLEDAPLLTGRNALILSTSAKNLAKPISQAFQSVEKLGEFTVRLKAEDQHFSVFLGRDLKKWPKNPQ